MSFTRSTTPLYAVELKGFDPEKVEEVIVTFSQKNTKIVKRGDDVTRDGNRFFFSLTQEETRAFTKGVVYTELKFLDIHGHVFASNTFKEEVKETLYEEDIA